MVALLVGLLIGLDRERSEARKQKSSMGGVRTFPLLALLGALSSLLQPRLGLWPLGLAFGGVITIVAVAYVRSSASGLGSTTEMAALVTFVLGVFAGQGALLLAGAVGVVVAVLLVAKLRLERVSRSMSEEEITATLELAVISAIVLPLVPNRSYGPWGGLNPFEVWLIVVLVSTVSFAGFVAMRLWGLHKGLLVAAFVGAMVSSTAVTLAMAERSRRSPELARAPAAGAVMASTLMCVRVGVLATAFAPALAPRLWPALAVMALVGAVCTVWLLRARRDPGASEAAPHLANPSSVKTALTFGLVYAAVGFAVSGLQALLGNAGTLLAAVVSAIVDVDAISITLARQAGQDEGRRALLALAVAVAAITNTLVKGGIAGAAGRGRFRILVGAALGAMSLAGAAVALLSWSWG